MRCALRVVLCLSLVGSLASPARAAEVTWQVSVGFGGVAKEGAWTPVFVDLSNEGESQAGQVVIPITFPGRVERVVNYAAEVDLPRHSKKRYTIYLPSIRFDRVLLDLSRTRERKDAPSIQAADPGDVVMVVVGGDTGFLSFLTAAKGLGVAPPDFDPSRPGSQPSARDVNAQVGHLGWSELPESWIGWDGVDAVVLGDAAFSGASQPALEALRQWVQVGGTLIVPGGALSTAMASSPLADLLPVQIAGTRTLPDLAPLGEWCERPIDPQSVLAARVALRPGARELCGEAGQPLVAVGRAGSGHVIFTAFDFTAAPVKYWDGQNALWPKLLANRSLRTLLAKEAEGDSYSRYYGGGDAGLAQIAATMPEAELPSLWLIIGFLVAYILILVPANYSFLNRIDRRELAWVTTPAIVLVFTLGAYAIGYGLRGGTVVLNRVGVIEAYSGATAAQGVGYVGLFSPARTTYELALQPTASGARDLAQQDQLVRGRATVYSMPKPRIADVTMNMWTVRSFGVDYLADLGKGVSGYLEYDGAAFVGRVKNDSGLTLKDCCIVRGTARSKGQELSPGEEAEVAWRPTQSTSLPNQPQYGSGGAHKLKLTESVLSVLFFSQRYGGYYSSGAPLLVASTKSLAAPVTLTGKPPQVEDATLVLVHLPIRLARHQTIQVPPWLIYGRIVATTGAVTTASDPYSSGNPEDLQVENGSLSMEFALPAEGGPMLAQRLELATINGRAVDPAAQVEAYDCTHRQWQVIRARKISAVSGLPQGGGGGGRGGGGGGMQRAQPQPSGPAQAGQNLLKLPHPQDFLSPDGRVQVKLSIPSGTATVSPFQLNATVQTGRGGPPPRK